MSMRLPNLEMARPVCECECDSGLPTFCRRCQSFRRISGAAANLVVDTGDEASDIVMGGSIPFQWETEPGKPNLAKSATSLSIDIDPTAVQLPLPPRIRHSDSPSFSTSSSTPKSLTNWIRNVVSNSIAQRSENESSFSGRRRRKSASKDSMTSISDSLTYCPFHSAKASSQSPRSILDNGGRPPNYSCDDPFYLSSSGSSCGHQHESNIPSPSTSNESSSSSNTAISSKPSSRSSLSFSSTFTFSESSASNAYCDRAVAKLAGSAFFPSPQNPSPLSLRQQHSMWLDFSSHSRKKKGKNHSFSQTLPTNEKPPGNTSSLRRSASDKNRLAMLDPTCSGLDSLFPLKSSRSSTFRNLEADDSTNFTQTRNTVVSDTVSGFSPNSRMLKNTPTQAPHTASRDSTIAAVDGESGTDNCPYGLNEKTKCRNSSFRKLWIKDSLTGTNHLRQFSNMETLRINPSEKQDSENSTNSGFAPLPKISRDLQSMADVEEELQRMKSTRHRRGSSCLPVFSVLPAAFLVSLQVNKSKQRCDE